MVIYCFIYRVVEKVSRYFNLIKNSEYPLLILNALLLTPLSPGTATLVPAPISDAPDPQFKEKSLASRAKARCL